MVGIAVVVVPSPAGALPMLCAFEASGTFHLDGDHECLGNGITVTSDNTKIFLDGHTLTGDGFSTGIEGATFDKIKIFGPGTLTGWGTAIDLTGSDKSKIFDVAALDSGTGILVVGNKNHLQDNTASNNNGWGIDITGQKNHLEATRSTRTAAASGCRATSRRRSVTTSSQAATPQVERTGTVSSSRRVRRSACRATGHPATPASG